MALTDKPITIVAAQTALTKLEAWPQANGSVTLIAFGSTRDGGGNVIPLLNATLNVTGLPVIDNLVARALTELRKANGLEV
jgi:hypothetical protein